MSVRGRGPPTRPARSCPTPGGPTRARMAPAPRPPTGVSPRSAWSLRTARCSRMRSFTSARPSWSSSRIRDASVDVQPVLGLLAPGQLEARYPARCGSSRARDSARSSAPACRSPARRPCARRRAGRARPAGAVVVGLAVLAVAISPSSLRMASSCRRSRNSRCGLLHALLDIGLDALPQGQVGQRSRATRPSTESQAGLHVEGLQHLHLLGQGEVGRVPGHVGHRPGSVTSRQPLGEPSRAAAQQDVLHHRAVLAGQLDGLLGGRAFGDGLDLDPQGVPGAGHRGAQTGPLHPTHRHRRHAAGQLTGLHHLGHHTH